MPSALTPAGNASGDCKSCGWQTMRIIAPASPTLLAIWSISPHGAPTIRFSTSWHSTATRTPSRSRPKWPARLVIVATSNAAELLTPPPSGTVL